MARIPFLKTHSRYREMADAYLDGELRPGELARYEAHAASCAECSAMLETGKALKASLGSIPAVAAPRSFRITPAMVQERAPVPAAKRVTPVLLVARVGAAASVAAFAVVGTLQFSSTSDDGMTTASAPTYELAAGAAEDDSANHADGADKDGDDGEVVPMGTESPQLAPPPSAEVGGAGFDAATPVPGTGAPDEGGAGNLQPNDDGSRSSTERDPDADDLPAGGTAFTALAEPEDGATDYGPWLVVLGGVSIVALGTLGTMEFRRRRA